MKILYIAILVAILMTSCGTEVALPMKVNTKRKMGDSCQLELTIKAKSGRYIGSYYTEYQPDYCAYEIDQEIK